MALTPQFAAHARSRGRMGTLRLVRDQQWLPERSTPILYPVLNLVTGTTPNGGGIWRYIVNDLLDHEHQNSPILSQVLHFLDFHLLPHMLKRWRGKTLRQHYRDRREPIDFRAPLFLDSGGFKLLFKPDLTLAQYGLLRPGEEAESILRLQKDFGGDLVASLDYPLPPNLDPTEARERMRRSEANALRALELLSSGDEFADYAPLLYIACHGLTADDIEDYVRRTLAAIVERGLPTQGIGIAIGSLVPLRSAHKLVDLVGIIQGALRGIPETLRATLPIHVFGVSGDLIPLLTYLGVDSFDSSTYIQASRSLKYYHPRERKMVPVLQLEDLPCDCRICRALDFGKLHDTLTAHRDVYRPSEPKGFKSYYYAQIALHNLEMERQVLDRTRKALEADSLVELLVEHAEQFPRLQPALQTIARDDAILSPRLTRVVYTTKLFGERAPLPGRRTEAREPDRPTISLRFTPDDFKVPRDYHPPADRDLLLIVPCSETKPYSESRSHQALMRRLRQALDAPTLARIHKISLSGLYGPVPQEHESDENVLHYNFLLSPMDHAQIEEDAKRLTAYLKQHGKHYQAIFGYATSKAYRTVLQRAGLQLYPRKPASQMPTEFYRNANLDELVQAIAESAGCDDRAEFGTPELRGMVS